MQCFHHPNITCRTEYPAGMVQSVCPKCLWRSKGIQIPSKLPPVQAISLEKTPESNIFDEIYINNESRVDSMSQKCKYCEDSNSNRAYRKAGFGENLDWLIANSCECE